MESRKNVLFELNNDVIDLSKSELLPTSYPSDLGHTESIYNVHTCDKVLQTVVDLVTRDELTLDPRYLRLMETRGSAQIAKQ